VGSSPAVRTTSSTHVVSATIFAKVTPHAFAFDGLRWHVLGLSGMAKALEEQRRQPDIATLAFEERPGLMVDRGAIEHENKRLVSRLKFAVFDRTPSSRTTI
jgi:hypothetical protein